MLKLAWIIIIISESIDPISLWQQAKCTTLKKKSTRTNETEKKQLNDDTVANINKVEIEE